MMKISTETSKIPWKDEGEVCQITEEYCREFSVKETQSLFSLLLTILFHLYRQQFHSIWHPPELKKWTKKNCMWQRIIIATYN